VRLKRGAIIIMLPPAFFGMKTGLAYLKFFGYDLRKTHVPTTADRSNYGEAGAVTPFDSR
jgi:hypothetical protein